MNKDILKPQSLCELQMSELLSLVSNYKKELFNLRFQKVLGEVTNTNRFAVVRKNVARVKTELSKRDKNA